MTVSVWSDGVYRWVYRVKWGERWVKWGERWVKWGERWVK